MLDIDKIKGLSQRRFIRDVFTLQCGSFISTVLSAITSIIFARLLGAENYGLYALIFSFVGLTGIFMDMGAGYAVLTLLPIAYAKKDKTEIRNILSYFIYTSLIIFFTIGLIFLLFSPYFTKLLYQRPQIGQFARYIIFAVMLRIIFSLLTLVLQSIRRIKFLTAAENADKFIYLAIPALFVFLGYGLWGIVFGHLVSAALLLFASWLVFSYLTRKDKLLPSLSEILSKFPKSGFWRYFKFGFFISINRNLGALYSLLPITFLGMFAATASQIAYFKIAVGYLGLSAMFMTAIARILLVQLPKSLVYGKETFKNDFKKVSLIAGFGFLALLLFFLLAARYMVVFFYGEQYLPAIKLIYILSFGSLMVGFAVGYSSFFRTLDKLKPLFWINLIVLASGAVLFFVFYNFTSPLRSTILLSIYLDLGTGIFQGLYILRYFKK